MSVDFPYFYRVCGLLIGSDLPLNELAEETHSHKFALIDISIKSGETSEPFRNDPVVIKPFTKFNAIEFYFELPNVIRILVRDGSEIQIDILTEDYNYALQSVYQNAIPIALLQRGIIPFRA